MADYTVRFTGLDNLSGTINSVKKNLQETGKQATKLDLIKDRFNRIQNSGTTLGRKIKDIRLEMEKLATSDLRSSIEGQRMWQDLATQARTYNNLLQEIRRSTMEATAAAPSGSNGFAKGLNINGAVSTLTSELGMGGVGSFAMSMGKGAPQAAAVAGVATVLYKAGKAASEFEVHLDRLQALTGLTDEKMKQVSDTAIEMSKNFKASAGEIVDSMTLIGSQAPQLLSDPEALASVTEAANVLAKAAGIEVIDSAKGITTVMNQMKVSASEVSGIINVLAASSQQGSADVAYLNTAFEKAGTAASSAGMNYTQLAAVIEAVAPKFSSADVAGSQLSSTLLKLSINASDLFNPAMVGMKTALDNMATAQLTDKQIKDMVGESNVTMLKTLIQQKDVYSQLEQSLANTNTAYDQAAIVSDNLQGKIGKLTSTWDAFLIKLGQSQYMQKVIDGIIALLGLAGEIINQIDLCIEAIDEFGSEGGEDINLLKIQMEVFTVVVKVLGGVLKALITVFVKLFNLLGDTGGGVIDWISDKWNEFMKQLNNTAFGREIIKAFKWIKDKVGEYLDWIIDKWRQVKEFFGFKDDKPKPKNHKSTNDKLNNHLSNTKPTANAVPINRNKPSGGGNNKSGGSPRTARYSAPLKAQQINYLTAKDDGSLDFAQKKLQALEKKLKEINTEDKEGIALLKERIKKQEEIVKTREQALGLAKEDVKQKKENEMFSLNWLEAEKSAIEEKMKSQFLSEEEIKSLQKRLKMLDNLINKESIRLGITKAQTDLEKRRNADSKLSSEYEQAKTDFNEGRIKYDDFIKVRDKYNQNRKDRGLNPDRPFEYTNPDTGNKELKDADETIKSVRSNLEGLGNVSTLSNFTNLGTQFQTMFAMFNDDKLDLTDLEKTDMLMEGIGAAAIIAGNSISNIGSELEKLGASGAVAKVGAVTAAIGQIVLGFAAASYQASKLGAIGWIAWLGAGLAALATTISTVSSFADGGIIQGSTFHGDKMLARVNAGEMILNQKQQSNLFNVLNNGTGSKAATSVVKIKGSDIYLALSNYNSKMSKIR